MNWTRRHTLAAGLGLIALTNAIALVGAAWNRSGEEARLRLTQRELQRPYWYGNRENSGIALTILWRVLPLEMSPFSNWSYPSAGSEPAWLDQAMMGALGFDSSMDLETERGRARFEKQLPREAFLVLELDGPAWRRQLDLVKDYAAHQEARLAASPNDKGLDAGAKGARDALEREIHGESRLFVVDAGLDAGALRAKYPDTARYAIVRGQVRPSAVSSKSPRFRGHVAGLSVGSINVPLEFRRVFAELPQVYEPDPRKRAPFEAVIAFGKRFEPWLVEAAKK